MFHEVAFLVLMPIPASAGWPMPRVQRGVFWVSIKLIRRLNERDSGMPLKIAAFPKCFIDEIAGRRSMSVFDWIEMARSLDADGLEMYDGFFTSLEPAYLDRVGEAISDAGFAMPMLCCSPDFTNPDPDGRKHAVEREIEMIRVARKLGGPGAVCRVLSGQRYPGLDRRQGVEWVVGCIELVLPIAREHDVVLG